MSCAPRHVNRCWWHATCTLQHLYRWDRRAGIACPRPSPFKARLPHLFLHFYTPSLPHCAGGMGFAGDLLLTTPGSRLCIISSYPFPALPPSGCRRHWHHLDSQADISEPRQRHRGVQQPPPNTGARQQQEARWAGHCHAASCVSVIASLAMPATLLGIASNTSGQEVRWAGHTRLSVIASDTCVLASNTPLIVRKTSGQEARWAEHGQRHGRHVCGGPASDACL